MKKKATAVRFAALLTVAVMFAGTALQSLHAQPSNENLIAEHFSQGQQAIKSGHYAQAAREFEEVLKLDPGMSQAQINLGLALHLLGDYARAAAELKRGLEQTPDVAGANVILGIDELKLGHPTRSIPPLRRALGLDPSNQQAMQNLAAAYAALGRYREANRVYRTAFNKRPFRPGDWLNLGKAYLSMAKQLGALMVHNSAQSSWVDRLAGDLLSERQRWNDAAGKYKSALAKGPRQPGLHTSLGKALLMQEKFEDARREFQSELQIDPHNPSALLGLAEIDLGGGQSRAALASIQQVAEGSPGFLARHAGLPGISISSPRAARMISELASLPPEAGLHYLLSALYRMNGESKLARQEQAAFQSDLERLSKRNRTRQGLPSAACRTHEYEACERLLGGKHDLDASQHAALAHAYFALGDYVKASDAFASAFSLKNSDPALAYWLSRTYIKLASQCFAQLDHHFPGSPQAYELRAEYYQMTGADAKAAKEYEAALKMEPHNGSLCQALGEIALKQHNLPSAERYIQEALAADPANSRSLYLMGKIAIGTAHPEEAVSYLKKALRYDPNYLPAHASLGIAYLDEGNAASAVRELNKSASLDVYGDLHYMLFRAYRKLGKPELAKNALAVSQALRRKTAAAALSKLGSLEEAQ